MPGPDRERMAQPFERDPETGKAVQLIEGKTAPRFESGGGGLFSTMDDYAQFATMLYRGGTFAGTRLLGRKTLDFMTADHLGPNVRIANTTLLQPGHRFGLGFAIRQDVGMATTVGTVGEYFWGGLAGTVVLGRARRRTVRDDDDPGAGTARLLSLPIPQSGLRGARLAFRHRRFCRHREDQRRQRISATARDNRQRITVA